MKQLLLGLVIAATTVGCATVGYSKVTPKAENLSAAAAGLGLVAQGEKCFLVMTTRGGKVVQAKLDAKVCEDGREYVKLDSTARAAAAAERASQGAAVQAPTAPEVK